MLNLKVSLTACIFLLGSVTGRADTIVVPNAQTNSPGNADTGGVGTYSGQIVQELYSSGQFTGPIDITGFSWRPAPGTGAVVATYGSTSIYLSYSPNSPNSTDGPLMSSTFANNVGMDQTLVFSGTNLSLTGAGCSGPGSCPFDIGVSFTTPFYYDPSAGNLLLEMVSTDTSGNDGSLDIEGYLAPGGPIALVENDTSATATTGSFAYAGLVTEFTYTPATAATTPEPPSWILTATAAMIASLWISRRRWAIH